jgi:hypothetical protein
MSQQREEVGGRREERKIIPIDVTGDRRRDAPSDGADFATWYAAYPRHVGRGAAERAYRTASKSATREALLAGAQAVRHAVDAGKDLKFVPHPATWLSGKRWLDDDACGALAASCEADVYAGYQGID